MELKTKLQKRLVSGFVLGPLVVLILFAGGILFGLFMLAALAISLYEWHRMSGKGQQYLIDLVIGAFYLPVSFLAFYALREWLDAGLFWSVVLILTVWASDSGAYFTGLSLRGPKMAPYLSPNKTWSGLGGAMIFSAVTLEISLVIARFAPMNITVTVWDFIAAGFAGLFLGAVGQVGDLSISGFKRRVGVKDTGHLIPGHGGLLDRIDSLLLVTPVFIILVLLLESI